MKSSIHIKNNRKTITNRLTSVIHAAISQKHAKNPDVTIILTVYNNEKYIKQAVKSIKRQSFRNFEALCFEDCSTDNSYQELEAAICGDPRFRIIRHDTNKGAAAAWNSGIEQAAGNFIVSVDGDDFIDRDAVRILYREITQGDFDVVAACFRICSESGKKIATKRLEPRVSVIDQDNFKDYFRTLKSSFWGKIWKKSLFTDNGIRFPAGLYYQDLATTPRLLTYAKRIKIIDNVLYNYRLHSASTTNSMSDKHISDYFTVFSILRDHFVKAGILERIHDEFVDAINENLDYHIDNVMAAEGATDIGAYIETINRKRSAFLEETRKILPKQASQTSN